MKKTFFALAFVSALLFAQNVFASSSPSLDGRAVVAESGTFPKGFFAKTVGYLPGDSISVTNPMNSRQVNVLVIGSLDASEGVAILLSPESAEALAIKKDSNNIVKLTKRSGTVDKVANGTAVITNPLREAEEELESEIAEAEEIEEEAADIAEAEEKEEIFEEAEIAEAEETFDEIPEEAEIAAVEEEIFDEIPEESEVAVAEEEEIFDEIPEEAEIAEAEDSFDEIPEEKVEVAEVLEEDEEAADEIVYELVDEYYIPDDLEEDLKANEPLDEIPEERVEFASEMEEAEDAPNEIVYERIEDDYISEDSDEVAKADEPLEEIPEESAESESYSEDVYIAESEVVEENVEVAEDEYEAIVLVPAEANPPESDESESDDEIAAPVVAKNEIATPPAEMPVASKGDATYLKSAAELEARKYYVQIAVYSQIENVEQLDARYGGRYPLTVLDEGARKTVLVGPLGIDEYGTVLERFKLFGFRDAFVRQTN